MEISQYLLLTKEQKDWLRSVNWEYWVQNKM